MAAPTAENEPALAGEQDRAYYRDFLANTRHYAPLGRDAAPGSPTETLGRTAAWLALVFGLVVVVRARRRRVL